MQTVYLHAPTCAHPCYVCSDWQGLSDLHGLYVQVRNPTGTGHQNPYLRTGFYGFVVVRDCRTEKLYYTTC